MSGKLDMSRRTFVLGTTATVAMTAAGASTGGTAGATGGGGAGDTAALCDLSATDAVAHMSQGSLSAERYAQALLTRCKAAHALNAFITLEPARVLEDARARDRGRLSGVKPGPLFGLPIPVKDSVNTRTTRPPPARRRCVIFTPADDAPVVKGAARCRRRRAGQDESARTVLWLDQQQPRLRRGPQPIRSRTDSRRQQRRHGGGHCRAPRSLGVAEDTEGSIRVPAALCGIAGFRPTTGRYSTRGCVPISPLFDQVGPLARSVADLVLFDSVAANDWQKRDAVRLDGVRLGVVRDYWFADLDPEVERLTELALAKLRDAGAHIVETQLPGLAALIDLTTDAIQNHDVRIALARYLKEYGNGAGSGDSVSRASPDIQRVFP